MSTKEILIARINAIKDEAFLAELLRLVDDETTLNSLYTLTPEEEKAVAKGIEASDKGEVYSHEQVKQMVEEWFKKK